MTAPVQLVPLDTSRAALAARWLSDPAINQWLASEWRDRQVTEQVLAVAAMNPRNRLYVIECEGQACGIAALSMIDRIDRTAHVWYCIGDRTFEGRGVATQALRALVRVAFEELELRSLVAAVMQTNAGSRRVLEKAGFRHAGTIRSGFKHGGQFVDRLEFDLLPEDLT